jgi:hypothetical protein
MRERRSVGGRGSEFQPKQNKKQTPSPRNLDQWNENITTFFVINFPNNVKAAHFLEAFARY